MKEGDKIPGVGTINLEPAATRKVFIDLNKLSDRELLILIIENLRADVTYEQVESG